MQSLRYPSTDNTIVILDDPITFYESGFNESAETESSTEESIKDQLIPSVFDFIIDVTESQFDNETAIKSQLDYTQFDLGHFFKDSVRMYLKEVGQIPLLDFGGEQQLGQRIELGKHLQNIVPQWHEQDGEHIDITDTVIVILESLRDSLPTINYLKTELGFPAGVSISQVLHDPILRDTIDGEISADLINQLAPKLGLHPGDISQRLIELSLNSRLVPQLFLSELESQGLVSVCLMCELDSRIFTIVDAWESQIKQHFEMIKHEAQQAKLQLVEANLRLVISTAKIYSNRNMPLMDAIQEGNIGLIRAVNKYDHRKGYKFSTYATWWIRQSVKRGMADQARTIRLPVHMVDRIQRLMQLSRNMSIECGQDPTTEDIATLMDLPVEKVEETFKSMMETVSMETPIGDNGDMHLSDYIIDRRASPAEVTSHLILKEQVKKILNKLPKRDREILRLRFGFKDGRSYTLEEIGRKYHITRERVRQIESNALKRLRSYPLTSNLRCYLDM